SPLVTHTCTAPFISFLTRRPSHLHLHSFPTRRSSDLYFQALGIRLLKGRFFTPEDDPQHPPVIIVSATTARHLFGSDDPIGQTRSKSTRLNSSHVSISYAVFCLKKKKNKKRTHLQNKK